MSVIEKVGISDRVEPVSLVHDFDQNKLAAPSTQDYNIGELHLALCQANGERDYVARYNVQVATWLYSKALKQKLAEIKDLPLNDKNQKTARDPINIKLDILKSVLGDRAIRNSLGDTLDKPTDSVVE